VDFLRRPRTVCQQRRTVNEATDALATTQSRLSPTTPSEFPTQPPIRHPKITKTTAHKVVVGPKAFAARADSAGVVGFSKKLQEVNLI